MRTMPKRKQNKQKRTNKNHKRQEQHGKKCNTKMQSKKHLILAKKQYNKRKTCNQNEHYQWIICFRPKHKINTGKTIKMDRKRQEQHGAKHSKKETTTKQHRFSPQKNNKRTKNNTEKRNISRSNISPQNNKRQDQNSINTAHTVKHNDTL